MQQQQLAKQELKQQRVDILLQDCQNAVIDSTLSAFGLTRGMFTDRDGGNVTTLHNFEKDDNRFVHDRDHGSYQQANTKYDRKDYTLSKNDWDEKKEQGKAIGYDKYTGQNFEEGQLVDLDHIVALKQIHDEKVNHLAFQTGIKQGKDDLKKVANSDNNLVSTSASINRSKGAKTNEAFVNDLSDEKLKELKVDSTEMVRLQKDSETKIKLQTDKKLFQKQSNELVSTGTKQAKTMAIKQIIGLLIVELANICFTEIKLMLKEGIEFNLQSLNALKQRLMKHTLQLAKKIPQILSQGLQGGITGFISNLITFLINQFFSTAKRVVTVMREGLWGLYRAVKIIFFPPNDMSQEEIWRTAIKLVTSSIIVAVSASFTEALNIFLKGFPPLIPVSEVLSVALMGIIGGLTTAFAVYLIDRIFDKFAERNNETKMDLLMQEMANSGQSMVEATQLLTLANQQYIEFREGMFNAERYFEKQSKVISEQSERLSTLLRKL